MCYTCYKLLLEPVSTSKYPLVWSLFQGCKFCVFPNKKHFSYCALATHKHTWSVTCGSSCGLSPARLWSPVKTTEEVWAEWQKQPKYGRKCFLAGQTPFEGRPKLVKLIYPCSLSSLQALSLSQLICISLYLFLYFCCLPPTLLVIPPCLPFSQFLPL